MCSWSTGASTWRRPGVWTSDDRGDRELAIAFGRWFRAFSVKVFTVGYTFTSLRSRDYRLLWLAQLSTSMGQWMDQMTRGWLMYELTGSPLQLGLATALRACRCSFSGSSPAPWPIA